MIIEIKDIPVNVKRVILEFDDSGTEIKSKPSQISTRVETSENSKSSKKESNIESTKEPAIDLDFGTSKPNITKDEVQAIKVPDKKRDPKVASSMQNLKI